MDDLPLTGDLTEEQTARLAQTAVEQIEEIKDFLKDANTAAELRIKVYEYNSSHRDVPESEGGLHEIETIIMNGRSVDVRFDRRGNIRLFFKETTESRLITPPQVEFEFTQNPILRRFKNFLESLQSNSLPNGHGQVGYLERHGHWPGLERRMGLEKKILKNPYLPQILAWVQKEFCKDPRGISYFEAGCGYGNDIRAFMGVLGEMAERSRFLGVDMSEAEIKRGLEYYHREAGEDLTKGRELFAQGDMRDLKNLNTWNDEAGDFSKPLEIEDGEFDLIFFETMLHGLGHGFGTYHEKMESSQKMLDELFRICKSGGRIFGQASTFDTDISRKQQFDVLRRTKDWRFIPKTEELWEMFKKAGFKNIRMSLVPHERGVTEPDKKYIRRSYFSAEK